MNLSEERNYQKMVEMLDALELTEKNRQLAEQYLDLSQPENRSLLSQAEEQDFSKFSKRDIRQKSVNYIEHCHRRNRLEEKERYIRFLAAAGGSTAFYLLSLYSYNTNAFLECLTKEQAAAIRAEGIVWNTYALRSVAENFAEKDPEILRGAMELCYHKSDNAKVLLAGICLAFTKPTKPQGGLKGLFGKKSPEAEKQLQETVDFLLDSLTGSIKNMTDSSVSDEDMSALQEFVRTSKATEPIPAEIYQILRGRKYSDYLITLLSGMAFLAIEHSEKFTAFLRLTSIMDIENQKMTTLDICFDIYTKKWFYSHIEALEGVLAISREDYIGWCVMRKASEPVRRMAVRDPEAIRVAVTKTSVDGMQYLLGRVRESNEKLYQELNSSYADDFRIKMAGELTARYSVGGTEARQYLLGEAELEVMYPFVKELRAGYMYADRARDMKLIELRDNGNEQMYRRALVLMGISQKSWFFDQHWVNKEDASKGNNGYRRKTLYKQQIQGILQLFEEEQVPVLYQMETLTGIYDSFYSDSDKATFMNECVKVIVPKKQEWSDVLISQAKDGAAIVRYLCIRVLDVYWQEYKEVLLSCAQDSSKQVRELLLAVYESHKEWEPEIISMLSSKKSQEREMAVLVLKKWGAGTYQAELSKALETEKGKKIKELLQGCLGIETDTGQAETKEKTAGNLAAELLKGGKKRKVAWAYETPFPQVHKTDGSDASEDYMQALLVAYADMNIPGVSADAAKLAKELDAKELAAYVNLLFTKWMEAGAEAKKKWVLYAASIHGGELIVPVLHAQIQEWPNVSRGAMAAEAVKALALNGSPTALLLVDQISRKFKFRQVKAAAADALTYAAEQLGITKAELEDRIVPNLGFDERMEQVFDYGSRKFTVALTPTLELQVTDESGKKLKSLPAPGKKDDEEKAKAASAAFKLLKKQLKTVVTNQKLRLEQALSTERLWQAAQWTELFVKNPVMHQFAIGLIWGCYENGALKDTFRYMEDGSFNTVDEDEYELAESGMIGLVHPIEMEKETLEAWKEQLSDYEIVQPVEQLERMVYLVTEEEKGKAELTRFGGKVLNGLSLSGKLQGMGWYRGSVQDGGGYYTFYREDGEIGVELEFSGAYVGDENEEVTVFGAQFYKAGTVKRGSYVYDMVKDENRYKLDEVNPRYFSEIVIQLTKATASSQEQLAYPECRKI